MANWAKLQEDLTGLKVVKRAKHGIHFDKGGGEVLANFVGKPCHFLDGGLWKPIDTKLLLLPDGFYGCPHSPVRVHTDGHVKVDGTDYTQYTALPSATGLVDNDCIVREFSFGKQEMRITENGYRSEITLNRIPTLTEARKLIASESGTLSKEYLKSLTTATDANGDVHTVTTLSAFRTWLASAKFPVVIDPDFAGDNADGFLRGQSTTYSTARSTCTYTYFAGAEHNNVSNDKIGADFYIDRCILKFDTSTIGDGSTVTQANIKLCHKESEGTATNVIKKFDWSSYEPIGAANRDAAYDACLAADQDGTATIGRSGYYSTVTSDNLTTSWVSKTGTTYYGIQNSNDVANSESTGRNFSIYCANENTTESRRPVLTVTYTAAGTFIPINMNAQMQNLSGNMRG